MESRVGVTPTCAVLQTTASVARPTGHAEAADFDSVVFQQMDVAVIGFAFQSFGKIWQRVPIELVIAQNIDDRFVRELVSRPSAPFAAKMNVTRHHDNIRVGWRNSGRSKFQMQIAENVQTHIQEC